MYIFIDTNLYQQFVRSSTPDSTVLKSLLVFLKKKKAGRHQATLVITDQVKDEYYRAEEKSITATRLKVSNAKSETEDVRDLIIKKPADKLSAAQKDIIKRLEKIETSFIKSRESRINYFDSNIVSVKETIAELFALAENIDCDEESFHRAEMRAKRGMHPKPNNKTGKDSELEETSMGDAINWELLLRHSGREEYVFISKDGDFLDEKGVLHKTLKDEWDKKRPGIKLSTFRSIFEFLDSKGAIKKPKKKKKAKKEQETPVATGPITISGSDEMAVSPGIESAENFNQFTIKDDNNSFYKALHFPNSTNREMGLIQVSGIDNVKFCPFCGARPDQIVHLIGGSKYCVSCSSSF